MGMEAAISRHATEFAAVDKLYNRKSDVIILSLTRNSSYIQLVWRAAIILKAQVYLRYFQCQYSWRGPWEPWY